MASNETDFSIAVPLTDFSVVKTQTGGNGVGEPVQYQVVITNTGAVPIENVVLVDTISPVVTGITTTQPGSFAAPVVTSTASGTRYVWSAAGLGLTTGNTLTFTVDGTMGLVCATTAVSNTAYVLGKNSCYEVKASSTVGSVVAQPVQNITIVKTQSPAAPVSLGPIQYQIVVTNTGAMTIDSMVVVDTVQGEITAVTQTTPAGFVARPVLQMPSGTLYSWASVPGTPFLPGQSVTFQLDGTVGLVCSPAPVSNTAYLVATTACSVTRMASNETDFSIAVPPTSITVVKTQTGGNGVGEPVQYQIVVTNTGAVPIEDVTLVDTVSPVVTSVTTVDGGFAPPLVTSVAGTGTRYVWSATGLGLAPLATLTFEINGTMGLVCANRAVSNTAYVWARNSCVEQRVFSNVVGSVIAAPVQDLTIVKTQNPAVPVALAPITYQIVVTNNGAMTVDSLIVVDTVQGEITAVTQTTPAGFAARPVFQMASGTLYGWESTAPFYPGTTATFQLDGTVGLICVTTPVSNTAYMVARTACSTTRMASNETDFSIAVPTTAISIVKTQTGGGGVGEPVTYQIDVTNSGAVVIDDMLLVDTVSPVVTGVTTTEPGGFAPPVVTPTASGTRYVWSAAGVGFAPGNTLTFTVNGTMGLVCATRAVSNTAYVAGKNVCTEVRALSNVVGSVIAAPVQSIMIVKNQIPAAPVSLGPITYQIVVTNNGAMTIDSLIVVDTVQGEITAVTQTTPAGFAARPVFQMASGTLYGWVSTAPFLPGTVATFQLDGTVGLICAPTPVSNTAYLVARTACSTTRMASNETDFSIPVPGSAVTVVKTQTGGNGIGEPVTYQIDITNTGVAPVEDITLVDTVSPVVTGVTTTEPGGFAAPAVVSVAGTGTRYVWSATGIGLVAGNTLTFTINGTMGLVCADKAVSNTAYVMASNSCAAMPTFSNMVGSVINAPIEGITIVKTQAPAAPISLGPVQYQIVVTNTGSATIDSLIVVDSLQPEITLVIQTAPAGFANRPVVQSASGTVYSWVNTAPFLPGTVAVFQLDATVGQICAPTPVSNTAFLMATTACTTTKMTSNETDFSVLIPPPSMTVVKTQTGGNSVGEPVQYQIVVTNTGGFPFTDVVLVDTISPVVTGVTTIDPPGFTPPSVAPTASGTRYVWSATGLSVPSGSSLTFELDGIMGLVCADKAVSNTAYVTAANICTELQGFSNVVGTVIKAPTTLLSISKTQSTTTMAPPVVGSEVSYRIVVTNLGSATFSTITIVDTVQPEIIGAVQETPAGMIALGLKSTPSGTIYSWRSTAPFLPGTDLTVTITGTVGLICVDTTVSNTAYVVATSACTTVKLLSNETDFTVPVPTTAISVVKTVTGGAGVGAPVTYRLDVTNTGSIGAIIDEISLVDTLSPVVTGITTDQPAGFGAPAVSPSVSGSRYVWTGTSLALASGVTLTVTITGTMGVVCANTVVSNTAYVTGRNICTEVRAFSNVDGSVVPVPKQQFTIVKTQTPLAPVPLGPIQYDIVVTNTGAMTIDSLLVVDTVQAEVTIPPAGQVTPGGFVPMGIRSTPSGTVFSWRSIAPVYPGASVTFSLVGTVGLICTPTSVSNTAYAVANTACLTATKLISNETDFTITPLAPDLTVMKTVTGGAGVGAPVTYTITVVNSGTAPLDYLTVVDTVSPVVTGIITTQTGPWPFPAPLVSPLGAPGAGTRYEWTFAAPGFFAPGDTYTFTVQGTMGVVCANRAVSNTAYAAAGNVCTEMRIFSNVDGSVIAAPKQMITIVKTQTPLAPTALGPIQYDIVVSNQGAMTVDSLLLVDTVPAEVVVAQVVPGGFVALPVKQSASGTIYSWRSVGPFFPGAVATFSLVGSVGTICTPTTVSNTAFLMADTACLTATKLISNDTGFTLPGTTTDLTVVKTVTGGNGVGEPVTYTIDVTNTGSRIIDTLVLVDTISPVVTGITTTQPFTAPVVTSVATGTRYEWAFTSPGFFPPTATFRFTVTGIMGIVCKDTIVSNTAYAAGKSICDEARVFSNVDGSIVRTPKQSLAIVKTQIPASPVSMGPITYQIDVTNNGAMTVDSMLIVDTVQGEIVIPPAGIGTPGGFSQLAVRSTASGTVYSWRSTAPFYPGATASFLLSGAVGLICVPSSMSNTAYVVANSACLTATKLLSNEVDFTVTPPTNGISVVKTVTGGNGVGVPVNYKIDVVNTGTSVIDDIVLVDTISPVVTGITTLEPGGILAPVVTSVPGTGTRYVWSAAGIGFAPGNTLTFQVNGIMGLVCSTRQVSNTAYATGMNVCTEVRAFSNVDGSIVPAPVPGISIVKTQTPAAPDMGSPVTYEILVKNTGTATITNLVVVDTVEPEVINAVQTTPGGFTALPVQQTSSGTVYSWVNSVPFLPGQSTIFRLDGTIGAVCTTRQVSNTAYLIADIDCLSSTRMVSNLVTTTVRAPVPAISVVKTMVPPSGSAVEIGWPLTYQIAVTNTGGVTFTNFSLVDTLSPVLVNVGTVASSPAFGPPAVTSVAGSGTRYIWSASGFSFLPGQVLTFTMTASAGVICAPVTVSNTAYVTVNDAVCGSATKFSQGAAFTIRPAVPNTAVTITQTPATGASIGTGSPVRYTIQVTNTGTASLTSLVVVDTLPPEIVQVVQTAASAGFVVAPVASVTSGTRYAWTSPAGYFLGLGGTETFWIDGIVGEVCTSRAVSNTAYVAGSAACSASPMTTARVEFTGQPYLQALSIVKTQVLPVGGLLNTGDPVQYTLLVTNTGAATLTDLAIVDTVSPLLESVTSLAPGLNTAIPVGLPGGGTRWVWSGTGLIFQPGMSLTITVDAKAGIVSAPTAVSNTAFVTGTNGCGVTVATAQSTPSTGFIIDASVTSIAVQKIQTPPSGSVLNVGDKITYLIVVTNTGQTSLHDIRIWDTVAPEVTLQTTDQDNAIFAATIAPAVSGTCWAWGNIFPGTANLNPGKSFSFTVTGFVGHVCADVQRDNVAAAFGWNPISWTATEYSTPVQFTATPPVPGVTITKTLTPSQPVSGGPMTYDITISNVGEETVANVHLVDLLPPTAEFTATVLQDATYSATMIITAIVGTQPQYDWDFGALAPKEVRSVRVSGLAGACYTGVISNTATVTGLTLCAAPVIQPATVAVAITAPSPNLTVWQDFYANDPTRTSHATLPQMGMPIYWKVIVANTGGKPAQDILIVDSLPSLDASIDRIEIPLNGLPASMASYGTPLQPDTGATAPVFYTTTGSGGLLLVVLGGTGLSLLPGESVTLYLDTKPYASDVGARFVQNSLQGTLTNPCSGVRSATLPSVVGFPLAGPVTLTVKIFNAAGEIVRSFEPLLVGRAPNQMNFSYTAGGACPNAIVDSQAGFSPEGDCVNDLVKFVFPQLIMADGQAFDRIWWDGKNDAGNYVPNGLYVVNVESVDIQTGTPVVIKREIVIAAKRTEVMARIFNSAGELVALLPTAGIVTTIETIKIGPTPFAPNLAGTTLASVDLYDKQGGHLGTLPWAGRTCDTADKTCATA
ncbi:MAG: hypothetical protein AAB152_18815, partial [Candidatus Coatesbacteria bacterium]